MKMTKKLEKLLAKYKKANRARLTAYARRSRIQLGVWDNKLGMRVTKIPSRLQYLVATNEVLPVLNAEVETARLYKLKVSAELRAYCKKKRYHIEWDSSNQVRKILSHIGWQLRRYHRVRSSTRTLLRMLHVLNLAKKHHCF